MSVGDDRIRFEVLPGGGAGPDMQAVFVGHCPGAVSREALLADRALAAELTALGHQERVLDWQRADDELYGLTLPIRSLAQLQLLFPQMQLADATDQEQARHWLPWAVQDYFAAGSGRSDGRMCWVIRVPEVDESDDVEAALDAFDARPAALRHESAGWGPVELACSVENAGLLCMPDFERLLLPGRPADVARKRLPNPSIEFHPCSRNLDDDHRERRYSEEMPPAPQDLRPVQRIRRIAARLQAWRPDLQWLLALDADTENGQALPRPRPDLLAWLNGEDAQANPALSQVQFLFPMVYGARRPLSSPGGLVCGHVVHRTSRDGVWRSVAGTPLSERLRPWPELGRAERARLREAPGLGVLYRFGNLLQLDDERLVTPAFCDHAGTACRSGELVRFVGWLRRSLRRLGEEMVFTLDGRDPVVANMLDAFLNGLHRKGALRGVSPQDAYRITRLSNRPELIEYRIEIAPSFPVDALVVTFSHQRDADAPRTQWEVKASA